VNRSPSAADVHQPDMKKIKREDKDGLVLEVFFLLSSLCKRTELLIRAGFIHLFPLDAPEGTGSVLFLFLLLWDSHCPLHRYLVPTRLLIPPAKGRGGAAKSFYCGTSFYCGKDNDPPMDELLRFQQWWGSAFIFIGRCWLLFSILLTGSTGNDEINRRSDDSFLLNLQISDGERSDQDLVVDDGGEVKEIETQSMVFPLLIGVYFGTGSNHSAQPESLA
jgi:hypothetical protein